VTRSPRARLVFRRRRKVAGDTGWLIIEDDHGAPIVEAAPPVTEQLRYIIERLRLQDPDGLPTRIGVTSALAGEGVTTVARALAGVLADDSAAKVCLVSLDWWTSDASPADRMGIAEVIAGEAETDEVLLATSIPGLEYIRAGSAEPATLPALVHDATLRNTLQELALRFHHVVVERGTGAGRALRCVRARRPAELDLADRGAGGDRPPRAGAPARRHPEPDVEQGPHAPTARGGAVMIFPLSARRA